MLRDNGVIERINRKFTCLKNDVDGNRFQKGIDSDSVLYTIFATNKLNNTHFFLSTLFGHHLVIDNYIQHDFDYLNKFIRRGCA